MSESRSHKTAANRLAAQHDAEYNQGPGVDIKADHVTIEVETPETVADAGRQLRGCRGPVYVAGTNNEAVERALDRGEPRGGMTAPSRCIPRSLLVRLDSQTVSLIG